MSETNKNYRELKLADDISEVLKKLANEDDIDLVKKKLVEIILFLRYEMKVRGSLRGERTESIGELEEDVILFLNSYGGQQFEEFYTLIYELIIQIPKFKIYGIDITELRDIAHDFDAEFRYDDVFSSIASDIRKLTHQHLSEKVIHKIEKFEDFLHSEKTSAMIEGSTIVNAIRDAKDSMLESPVFKDLISLKDKLKTAWSDAGDNRNYEKRREFFDIMEVFLKKIDVPEMKSLDSFDDFTKYFDFARDNIDKTDWIDIQPGHLRYYLKKLIYEISISRFKDKGDILFSFITADSLLEQISFIYYSNMVNGKFKEITDETYLDAMSVVIDLALSTRAVGHGTKILGRFAFLIKKIMGQLDVRPDRVAHFPSIVEAMNSELENNFMTLKNLYASVLIDKHNSAALTSILNNTIREKSTHLLANLINSIKSFEYRKFLEPYDNILELVEKRDKLDLGFFVFQYGTDVNPHYGELENPQFMGGKGLSQIRNSRIISENSLKKFSVPPGYGFSTLTWNYVNEGVFSLEELTEELSSMVKSLEKRTGKEFGNGANPLILMARSGAVASMPGILETVSHIGLNAEIVSNWSKTLAEPQRAYQAYLTFMQSYAASVLGLESKDIFEKMGFESSVSVLQEELAVISDIAKTMELTINEMTRGALPTDPFEQLYNSTIAVFRSFENDVVRKQMKNMGVPGQFQTACLIQECLPVLQEGDCSGVFFTRNPGTGKIGSDFEEQIEFSDGFFGDVIADGTISPSNTVDFIRLHPEHYENFKKFKYFDERIQRYPTDIEFAIRNGVTNIVQSRVLKQSPIAMISNSFDFYRENIYTKYKLIKRTAFGLNKHVTGTYLDRKAQSGAPVLIQGKPVNGGAVRGRIIKNHNNIGMYDGPLIFITESNVPSRVIVAENRFSGYVSKEGGVTSHAALVAIGEGKPCVTDINWEHGVEEEDIVLGDSLLKEGDYITLDANTGNIYLKDIPIKEVSVVDVQYGEIKNEIFSVIEELVAPIQK